MSSILKTKALSLKHEENNKLILNSVNLEICENTLNLIIGANGAGKSSFLNTIAGIVPEEMITGGDILFQNKNIETLSINERADLGIFLSFQNPVEIPGLKLLELIKKTVNKRFPNKKISQIIIEVKKWIEKFNLPQEILDWEVNSNLSGGQKKLCEVLQMLMFEPKLLLVDEIDSGLDFDKIKIIANIINHLKNTGTTILLVSHHHSISDYLDIDNVVLFQKGGVTVGSKDLLVQVKKLGYE